MFDLILRDAEMYPRLFGGRRRFQSPPTRTGSANIEPVSTVRWERGLSRDFYVFHTGIVDSVFRKSDGAIFSLPTDDPAQMIPFGDLNEWYVKTLRSEYTEKYGLEAVV